MNERETTENAYDIILNGNVLGIEIRGTHTVTESELRFLATDLCVDPSNTEVNMFESLTPTQGIQILMLLNKTEEAWKKIMENLGEIDFSAISETPNFKFDRYAREVYKALYDNSVIDIHQYMYFNVLSGKIFDIEAFTEYVKNCSNATEFLGTVYSMFNGVNPYEVGLVELTKPVKTIFDELLEDGEDLTEFIFGHYVAFEFTPKDIYQLIKTSHIDPAIYPMAFAVCANYENTRFAKEEIDSIVEEILGMVIANGDVKKLRIFTIKQIEYIADFLKKNGPAMSDDTITAVVSNIYTSMVGSFCPNITEKLLFEAGIDVIEKYSYINLLDCAEVEDYVPSIVKRYQLGYFTGTDLKIDTLHSYGYDICPYMSNEGLSYVIIDFTRMMLIIYEDGGLTTFDITRDEARTHETSASYTSYIGDSEFSWLTRLTNTKPDYNDIEGYENSLKLNDFFDDHNLCVVYDDPEGYGDGEPDTSYEMLDRNEGE